ncbi:MAG TPA: hypothetical protein VG756_24620 [Pseudonocardiaceae bacterium]|jgi:hypothetical protein|nr:hypothetical protein [Pseudonocardiaceae bacterium]
MDEIARHALAVDLVVLGATGVLAMLLYRAAIRYGDLDHGPAWAMARIRWWSRHAAGALTASGLILAAGVLTLVLG